MKWVRELDVRPDIIIAVCALLISALATGATYYQSKIVERQLSAQVWPYVSISNTFSPDSLDVTISNDGLGPAVVRSLVVTVDGKPQRDVASALSHLVGDAHVKPHETISFDSTSMGSGGVLAVGGKRTVMHLQSATLAGAAAAQYARVDITTCYCAIIVGNCWHKDGRDENPVEVSSCPESSSNLVDPTTAELHALFRRYRPKTS